uniref:Uncharacterized protein n=1 Tax=Aegilops tauschii TaxID=37682 RepID=R7W730_AEGTA
MEAVVLVLPHAHPGKRPVNLQEVAFSFLCADAGGRSCFVWADGPAAVLDRSNDSGSLPSGRDTFRGTQSQRWRRLLQGSSLKI